MDGHENGALHVSSHLHLNVTYLLEADETDPLAEKRRRENSGVAWFGVKECWKPPTEPWFQKRVYGKLNEKLAKISIKSL